jgi:hypothetical protein
LIYYLHELAEPIKDPELVLSEYLREHAAPTDVVLAQYGDLPVQFYTGLRVAGGMQGQPLPPNPDWIILRPFILSGQPGKDGSVREFVLSRIPNSQYERVPLAEPDLMLGNSPEPQHHLYRAPASAPPLFLFRRHLLK